MPVCGQNSIVIGQDSGCLPASSLNSIGTSSCGSNGDCGDRKIGTRHSRGRVIQEIKEYCLTMLGYPVVEIELNEQQLDIAINTALKIIEYYAPREYFQYYTFRTTPAKSVYEMPPEVGYIRQVSYRETAEFAFQSTDLDGSLPIEYFYPGGAYASIQGGLIDPLQPIWGRAGDWNVYKMYERIFAKSSSALGGWEYVGGYRHIKLYPIPMKPYGVIVHYMQKCKDWDQVNMAMLEGSLAHVKMILGRIRSKYASLPGPSGGIQLDGDKLLQEGLEEYKQWKEDLVYKFGDIPPITYG